MTTTPYSAELIHVESVKWSAVASPCVVNAVVDGELTTCTVKFYEDEVAFVPTGTRQLEARVEWLLQVNDRLPRLNYLRGIL